MRLAPGQAELDQTVNDPRHGRPRDALDGGQPAQRAGTAEDQYGQRAQSRVGKPGHPIDGPHPSQQVDGRRIQLARGLVEIGIALGHQTCIACLPINRDAT